MTKLSANHQTYHSVLEALLKPRFKIKKKILDTFCKILLHTKMKPKSIKSWKIEGSFSCDYLLVCQIWPNKN